MNFFDCVPLRRKRFCRKNVFPSPSFFAASSEVKNCFRRKFFRQRAYRPFFQDIKQIFFNVIKFVEKEKFGAVIPLFNVNERLSSMLGISMRSVVRLKSEMNEIEHDMMERERKMDEEKEELVNRKVQVLSRLQNLRSSSSSSSS
jgi:hypothetical protein